MTGLRLSSIHALVGDDDASVRECVVEIVRSLGLTVHTAACGTDALRVLVHQPIHLTILDVHMPDMTGFDVVERYRRGPWIAAADRSPARREARRAIPTIFMSGDATPDMHDNCARAGWPLLDKPFDMNDMRQEINRILHLL